VRVLIASMTLAAALASAEDAGSRSFVFEYTAAIEDIVGPAKLWIPVPQTTAHQVIGDITIESPQSLAFVTDATYGNRFAFFEYDGPATDIAITLSIPVTRDTRRASPGAELSDTERTRYLKPSRMVTTEGVIREEAVRVAGDAKTNREKARRLYDHIVNTVRYDKSGEGWGRGDAVYACDARAGNCTDFHSLFIGEARALGVPARFLMGFSVPKHEQGDIGGYHCWGEYYDEATGWTPVDASEAQKDKSRRDELFGGLDADRVQFTMGRDIALPGMKGEPLNFAIYPYVEVNGKPHAAVRYSFAFREKRPKELRLSARLEKLSRE
jgi:hypothetical protein